MKLFQNKYFYIILLVSTACALVSINFSYGYFEDVDVWEILKRAWRFPTEGWGPSRSWGFPMYELFLYPTIQYFGLRGAKIQSAVFYILSGLLFFKLLLYLTKDYFTSFLGSLSFLVHPISVITSSAIVATSQEVFFALASLYFFFRYFFENKLLFLYFMTLFLGFATATRQDYLVLSCAMAVTLLVFRKIRPIQFLLSLLMYCIVTLGLYILFYGVHHFTSLDISFLYNDPFSRRFVRAILGYGAIFGLPTLLLISVFVYQSRLRFKEWKKWVFENPCSFLFLCASIFYFIRFAMNADKLEYVWILFLIFIILSCVTLKKKSLLLILFFATALPNVLQIHFFRREGRFIKLDIGFSPGAIAQDRSGRLKNQYRLFGDYEADVAKVAKEQFGCQNHFWYLAEPPDESYCIVVPEEMLRFWNPDRLRRGVDREKLFQRKIIVFDFPDNRGWRQFMKFKPWKKLEPTDFHLFSHK